MRLFLLAASVATVWSVTDETPPEDVAQECPFSCAMEDSPACPCGYGDDLDPCGDTFTLKMWDLLTDGHPCHTTIMNYCCFDDASLNDSGCDKVMGVMGKATNECPTECKDDVLGTFDMHGGCPRLVESPWVNCGVDLNAVITSDPVTFPRGSLASYTCPYTCKMGGRTCAGTEFESSSEDPEPIAPITFPTAPPLQGEVPHTVLEWSRPVEGCGKDREIPRTGMARVTWAMGHDGTVPKKPKKLTYHKKRGSASIPLLKKREEIEMPADVRTFDFVFKDVHVHHDVAQHFGDFMTFYYCQTFKLPDWAMDGKKRHVIRIDPILTPGNEQKVHHNLMYSCPFPDHMEGHITTDLCGMNPNMPPELMTCMQNPIFAVYSIGADPVYYPKEAGFPIGVGYDNKFIANMHYDNYDFQPFNDASGFRFYVTETLREHDVGVAQFGAIMGIAIPPGEKDYTIHSRCPADQACMSEEFLGKEGVTITHSFLHGHLWTTSIQTDLVDAKGKVLANIGYEPSYDFDLQNIYELPKPLKFMPGMGIDVTCTYNTESETETVWGGESTSEEMCIGWVVHYPAFRKKIGACYYIEFKEGSTFNFNDPTQAPPIGTPGNIPAAFCLDGTADMNNPPPFTVGFTMDRKDLPKQKCNSVVGDDKAVFGDYGSLSELDAHLASYDYKYTLLHGQMELYWTFHPDTGMIDFALDAATDGWAGIGISPTGGMPGSDIMVGWINEKKGRVVMGDYYAEGHVRPKYDKDQSLFNMKATRVIRIHGQRDIIEIMAQEPEVEIRWVRVVAVMAIFGVVAFTISRVRKRLPAQTSEEKSLLQA